MNTSSQEQTWVNQVAQQVKNCFLLAAAGKFKDYLELEILIMKSFERATSEFGVGEEWILMESLDDLIVEIVNDSTNNQAIGPNPVLNPNLMALIVRVSRNTDWSMWEFYAALNPSTPTSFLEELAESTFSWEENSTKEAVANNPSTPGHIRKKLLQFIHTDINDLEVEFLNLENNSNLKNQSNSKSTYGYESQIIDFAEEQTTAVSLVDDYLLDLANFDEDLNFLRDSYSKMLTREIDLPEPGSYVWLPQMYKLPMGEPRAEFDANFDVHLIENYSKKILIKSDDPDFADSIDYQRSDFWRIVLIRTGEKSEYQNKEDVDLLKSQIKKASEVFELSEDHFSAAIKWVRLEAIEEVIENRDLLPK